MAKDELPSLGMWRLIDLNVSLFKKAEREQTAERVQKVKEYLLKRKAGG